MSGDDIINLDEGFSRVKKEGIQPFLEFIEASEREFFKAKDFVMLYDLIFKMCIQRDPYNWSEAMYEKYTHSILGYLDTVADPALKKATLQNYEDQLLTEWKTRWANHKLVVLGLSKLFMYLDRFFTPNTDGILSLKEQGFKAYKEKIFDPYCGAARAAILNAIDKERNNEEQDRHLLQDAVSVFVEMGYNYNNKKLAVYTEHLEKSIVEHAGQYYQRKSRLWMDQDSCPIYLEKAEKMLAAEKSRVEAYLNRSTLEPLNRECYYQLLKVHQKELLRKKTGLAHLLTVNAVEDLSRLYRLYKSENKQEDLEPVAEMLLEHIKKAGTEVVDKARAPAAAGAEEKTAATASNTPTVDANHALVRNLIALHAQYNEVVSVCFEKAQVMQKALKKAFEEFINSDNRVSKLLAKFVNDVLKKGTKVNVKDMESTLDEVVFLYGYIQEKDVFERDYQIFLSNRLLMGLCESEHSEKSMIAKLKTECVDPDTLVYLSSGQLIAVRNLEPGMELMGDDGQGRRVDTVGEVKASNDMYVFKLGTGARIKCTANHIMPLKCAQVVDVEVQGSVYVFKYVSSVPDRAYIRREFKQPNSYYFNEKAEADQHFRRKLEELTAAGKVKTSSDRWQGSKLGLYKRITDVDEVVHSYLVPSDGVESLSENEEAAKQYCREQYSTLIAAGLALASGQVIELTAEKYYDWLEGSSRAERALVPYRAPIIKCVNTWSTPLASRLAVLKGNTMSDYCVGMWLGDGITGEPGLANTDPELIRIWCDEGVRMGLSVHTKYQSMNAMNADHPSDCCIYLLTGGGSGTAASNPIINTLREYGMYDNKNLDYYIKNNVSRERRLEVLAGLLDTDGCYYAPEKVFQLKLHNKRLLEGAQALATLLQFNVSNIHEIDLQPKEWGSDAPKANFRDGQSVHKAYHISMRSGVNQIPTVLARKRAEAPIISRTAGCDMVREWEKTSGEYVSITITDNGSNNKRFVLENGIVSHNCGYQWTNKLEGMFKDVQLSKDLMASYKKMYAASAAAAAVAGTGAPGGAANEPEVQLEVNVCTTGYWPCLSADHEILTRGGWKNIADVRAGIDNVFTINATTRVAEWQVVEEAYAHLYPANQPLYRLHGDRLDAVCTPDHRWLTFASPQRSGGKVSPGRFDKVTDALRWSYVSDDSYSSLNRNRLVPLSAVNPNPHYSWDLPFLPQDINTSIDKNLSWCKLIGFFIGDGGVELSRSTCNNQQYQYKYTNIYQNKQAGQIYVEALLDLLGLEYTITDDQQSSRTCRLSIDALYDFFLPMTDDISSKLVVIDEQVNNRCLSYDWKSMLSSDQARALIEGWVAANGDWSSIGTESLLGYTTSIPLRDDLMLLGALANCRVSSSLHKSTTSSNLVDNWSITFHITPTHKLDIAAVGLYKPEVYVNPNHDGHVYSISVKNQNYYTRRSGSTNDHGEMTLKPFFTGNSSKIIPCLMPKDLVSACEKYKRFYLNQHSGHKLEWRYDQGQAELSVDFSPTCRKGIVCSTYQMMILLVFNTIKIVTYKQILDLTGIPRYEIANHLLSLCHPKVGVVLKKPNSKKLLDTDQFMLNKQYKNQLKKVNIPLLRAVENEEGGEEENKAIELQRRHQMDAAIVRIMKTRKQLRHNLLTAEVIQQLSARFKPKPNDIKKRIEALIEQEYMERDATDRGTYNYLA